MIRSSHPLCATADADTVEAATSKADTASAVAPPCTRKGPGQRVILRDPEVPGKPLRPEGLWERKGRYRPISTARDVAGRTKEAGSHWVWRFCGRGAPHLKDYPIFAP